MPESGTRHPKYPPTSELSAADLLDRVEARPKSEIRVVAARRSG